MKIKSLMRLSAVCFLASTSLAHAATTVKTTRNGDRPINTTQAATTSSSTGGTHWGLGITSLGSTPAVSAWMEFDHINSLQTYLSVTSTSPFVFNVGGVFRHGFIGTRNSGLHFGGGLSLGTTSGTGTPFAVDLGPIAGIHYALPQLPELLFSLDAGAILSIVDSNVDFSIAGLSSILGLSVHYFY